MACFSQFLIALLFITQLCLILPATDNLLVNAQFACSANSPAVNFKTLTAANFQNFFVGPTTPGTEMVRGEFRSVTNTSSIIDFNTRTAVRYTIRAPTGRRFILERTQNMNNFRFVINEQYIMYRNECSPNPCLNSGVCTEGVNQFTCTCPASFTNGFTGSLCQLPYSANRQTCPTANQFVTVFQNTTIGVNNTYNFTISPSAAPIAPVTINMTISNPSLFSLTPQQVVIPTGSTTAIRVDGTALAAGSVTITFSIITTDDFWKTAAIPPISLTILVSTNRTMSESNSTSPEQYVCCSPQANPCLNGGTCVTQSDQSSFRCSCPDGFTGLRCETSKVVVPTFFPTWQTLSNVSADFCLSFDGLVGPPPEYNINNVLFNYNGIYVRVNADVTFTKRDTSERRGVSFTAMHMTITPRINLIPQLLNVTSGSMMSLPPTYYEYQSGTAFFIGSAPGLTLPTLRNLFLNIILDEFVWQSQVERDSPKPIALGHVYPDLITSSYLPFNSTRSITRSTAGSTRGLIQLPRWQGRDSTHLYTYSEAVAACSAIPAASDASPYRLCNNVQLARLGAESNFSSCLPSWTETSIGSGATLQRFAGIYSNYGVPCTDYQTGLLGLNLDASLNPHGTGFFSPTTAHRKGAFCCSDLAEVPLDYYISSLYRLDAPNGFAFQVTRPPNSEPVRMVFNHNLLRNASLPVGTTLPLDICVAFNDFTATRREQKVAATGTIDTLGNVLSLYAEYTFPENTNFTSLDVTFSARSALTHPNLKFALDSGSVFFEAGTSETSAFPGSPLTLFPAPYQCSRSCTNGPGNRAIISSFSGTLHDGSADLPYSNNVLCEWIVAPSGAEKVIIEFTRLWTEPDLDFVEVFDFSTATNDVGLKRLHTSGFKELITSQATADDDDFVEEDSETAEILKVVSNENAFMIRFTSNPSATFPGWVLRYQGCNRERRCTGHGSCDSDGGCTCDYEYDGPTCRSCFLGYEPARAAECTDGLLRAECDCILPPTDVGVRFTARILLDFTEVYSFEETFLDSLAAALNLDRSRLSRVIILSVDNYGAAEIQFYILPGRGARPIERAQELLRQIEAERSLLKTLPMTERIDSAYIVSSENRPMFRCSDGIYRETCPSVPAGQASEQSTLWNYALAGLIIGLVLTGAGVAYLMYRNRTATRRKVQQRRKEEEERKRLEEERMAREQAEREEQARRDAAEAERQRKAALRAAGELNDDEDGDADEDGAGALGGSSTFGKKSTVSGKGKGKKDKDTKKGKKQNVKKQQAAATSSGTMSKQDEFEMNMLGDQGGLPEYTEMPTYNMYAGRAAASAEEDPQVLIGPDGAPMYATVKKKSSDAAKKRLQTAMAADGGVQNPAFNSSMYEEVGDARSPMYESLGRSSAATSPPAGTTGRKKKVIRKAEEIDDSMI